MEFRGSWFVVAFFMYLHYCTVVQICCTCTVNKNTRRTTGTRRALIQRLRTEVLRTRTYFSTANTLLRSRASRGHLNLLNGKSTVVRGWCPTYILDGPVYMGEFFLLCSCCRTPTGRGGPRARARAWAPRVGRAPRYQQHT